MANMEPGSIKITELPDKKIYTLTIRCLICYNLVILQDDINLVTTEFDKILAVVPPRSSGARGREQQMFFVIRVVKPS
jgi:hypothetical protein